MTIEHNIDTWTPKLVEERLIAAARLIVATAGPVGPKGYGVAMPTPMREWGDWLDELADDADRPAIRISASQRQMTLMEEAIRWPVVYLAAQDGPRRVLSVFLRCRAYRKPFGRACKRNGWPRATAYRARDKALSLISQGLDRDGIPIQL